MSLRHERDNAIRVLDSLMGYFRSGNRVPVERAVIYGRSVDVQDAMRVLHNPRVRLMPRTSSPWRMRKYRRVDRTT